MHALGALTGNQAVQQVRAGLKAIYLSGWQVAADANLAGQTYPDQSLYPANSVPAVVRRINNALLRADQIDDRRGHADERDWLAPIVADAEAGFGGPLNAYELMHAMIAAGAAGVHWEDQLASEKKCGHLGGKVLVPTGQHIRTLNAARLAADVAGVPTLDHRPHRRARRDAAHQRRRRARPAVPHRRAHRRGLLPGARSGIEPCIARGLAYAPLRRPALGGDRQARPRAGPHVRRGDQGASSPTSCWPTTARRRSTGSKHLDDATIAKFQRELGDDGLQVPVHHPRRLPRAQPLDVRPGPRLRRPTA